MDAKVINQTELGKLMNRGKDAMRSLSAQGALPPSFRLGNQIVYARADVDAFIESYGLCLTAKQWQEAQAQAAAL